MSPSTPSPGTQLAVRLELPEDRPPQAFLPGNLLDIQHGSYPFLRAAPALLLMRTTAPDEMARPVGNRFGSSGRSPVARARNGNRHVPVVAETDAFTCGRFSPTQSSAALEGVHGRRGIRQRFSPEPKASSV